jgi:hypothetical protein
MRSPKPWSALGIIVGLRALKDVLGGGVARARLLVARQLWKLIPSFLRSLSPVRGYGMHLHGVARRHAGRRQYFGTFFFRNRAELELIGRLVARAPQGSTREVSVLACSKGAEVYSIAWTIRAARPDLNLRLHAVDISADILAFAMAGVYSLKSADADSGLHSSATAKAREVTWNTCRDQNASMFERMTDPEMRAMFDRDADQVSVKSSVRLFHWQHLAG